MENKRFYSLDLLKYISSIFIVFHHFQQVTGVRFENINFCDGKLYIGYLVELFAMISGFLCIYTYKNVEFKDFIKHKISRIYPMAVVSTIAILVLEAINILVFRTPIKKDGLGIWTILNSFLLTFRLGITNIIGTGINNPLWYLGVLLICYISFYFANKTNKKYKTLLYIIIICFSTWGVENNIDLPFLTVTTCRCYASFYIGLLLNEIINVIKKKTLLFMSAFSSICLICIFLFSYDYFVDNLWQILVFVIYPSIIILLIEIDNIVNCSKVSKIFSSYFEVYVWHYFFIRLLQTIERFNVISIDYSFTFMVCFTILICIFSYIFNKCFSEKLSLNFEKICNNLTI